MFRLLPVIAILAIGDLRAANLSGKWSGFIETEGIRTPISVSLLQAGQEISGRVAIGAENSVPIEKAEIHGEQLTFELHDNTNRVVTYRLALNDGLITGEASAGGQVFRVNLRTVTSSPVYKFVPGPDSAPVLVHKVEPEYTEEARAAKFQGTVRLEAEVGPDGRISPEHFKVLRSLGMGLDEKAIEAVKHWIFKPAHKDGKPVPRTVTIELNFRL